MRGVGVGLDREKRVLVGVVSCGAVVVEIFVELFWGMFDSFVETLVIIVGSLWSVFWRSDSSRCGS